MTTRCAIYCRKSVTEGLDQDFNSLDAQREACEAYIASQAGEGWTVVEARYDDGGFTGGNMDRPALRLLLRDIEAGRVDCIVVHKVDRLSRSLMDFARMIEVFDEHDISFVSVTQQFSTANSIGRLTLNMLLSFAQFEREMISERTKDKIAATRRKGKWTGGQPVLGYDVDRTGGSPRLVLNADEAARVVALFEVYFEVGSISKTVAEANRRGWRTKTWTTKAGQVRGGQPFTKASMQALLTKRLYRGEVVYDGEVYAGEHEAIVSGDLWQRVQDQLAANRLHGGAGERNRYGALLRGLLRCTPCGAAMTHSMTKRDTTLYRYYVCTHAQKKGWDTCPTKSIPAREMEQFVIDQIRVIGRDETLIAKTVHTARAEQERELERLTAEEKLLRHDRATACVEDIAVIDARLIEIEATLASLARGEVTESEVRAALIDFDALWNALTLAERARVVRLLIERIEYDGETGALVIHFHPTGLQTLATERAAEAAA